MQLSDDIYRFVLGSGKGFIDTRPLQCDRWHYTFFLVLCGQRLHNVKVLDVLL